MNSEYPVKTLLVQFIQKEVMRNESSVLSAESKTKTGMIIKPKSVTHFTTSVGILSKPLFQPRFPQNRNKCFAFCGDSQFSPQRRITPLYPPHSRPLSSASQASRRYFERCIVFSFAFKFLAI